MAYAPTVETAFYRLHVVTLRGGDSHLGADHDAYVTDYDAAKAALVAAIKADVLLTLAAWIRTPGNIHRDDAIDECARLLENNARS